MRGFIYMKKCHAIGIPTRATGQGISSSMISISTTPSIVIISASPACSFVKGGHISARAFSHPACASLVYDYMRVALGAQFPCPAEAIVIAGRILALVSLAFPSHKKYSRDSICSLNLSHCWAPLSVERNFTSVSRISRRFFLCALRSAIFPAVAVSLRSLLGMGPKC